MNQEGEPHEVIVSAFRRTHCPPAACAPAHVRGDRARGRIARADFLADLAKPHEGRSMRETSTHRISPDGKYNPQGEFDPTSNSDNRTIPPGRRRS